MVHTKTLVDLRNRNWQSLLQTELWQNRHTGRAHEVSQWDFGVTALHDTHKVKAGTITAFMVVETQFLS